MKPYIFYPVVGLTILLSSCKNDDDSFGNAVYLNTHTTAKVIELFFKPNDTKAQSVMISASIPKPQEDVVTLHYKVDFSQVDQYNHTYGDHAVALPSENYELPKPKVEIAAGNVRSSETVVKFKNLNQLDREVVYVLPITISDANIPILGSARMRYFVFKGAALINVVADIEENYLSVNWAKPNSVNNLSQLTMEALVRARSFEGKDVGINALMGNESTFMIRIGDAGFPNNQIQVYKGGTKSPDVDTSKGLPVDEWLQIAITYNGENHTIIIYVNGQEQSKDTKDFGNNIDLTGGKGFFIGKEYNNNRYFRGEIAECRIWNVVRTPEEIANHRYSVEPDTEGLVAYWKFDEGAGEIVKDHTANGNDAKANKPLTWNNVSLPPAKKE